MRADDIVASIGNTPLVGLPSFSPRAGVRIWAKLEGANPTGSAKDRIARAMIEDAERRGLLESGRRILEPTSGNTGIALAMIARRRGYGLTVVMPDNAGEERIRLLEAFGATIVFSPGEKGTNGSIVVAQQMVEEHPDRWFMPYQYANEANPRAHYEGTGAEIVRDLPDVTHFVAGLGTGGTLTGTGRRLKEHDASVQVIAAEPELGEGVYGLRSMEEGFVPPVFDPSILDAKYLVDSSDALHGTRLLAEREGIFAGISSGAVVVVARRIAERLDRAEIVCLLADGGWKYLSTQAWDRELARAEKNVSETLWW